MRPEQAVSKAIQKVGLVEHGPRRINHVGAPIASAAPIGWAYEIITELRKLGFQVVEMHPSHPDHPEKQRLRDYSEPAMLDDPHA